MKHFQISILIMLLLAAFSTAAQVQDTIAARVYYTFTHVEDTLKKDQPRVENMLLLVGKNSSFYTSADKITVNLDRMRQVEEQKKNATPGNDIHFVIKSLQMRYSQTDFYQFAATQKLVVSQSSGVNYLIETPLPVINWKIGKDTMIISGLHCTKAEGNFKGRDYTAWFCMDLPFSSGPWKLNGLPGLIVAANDSANEVVFKLNGLEILKPADFKPEWTLTETDRFNPLKYSTINLPKKGVNVTPEAYEKLMKAKAADPEGVAKAALSNTSISYTATQKNPATNKFQLNNPIEKPETAKNNSKQ